MVSGTFSAKPTYQQERGPEALPFDQYAARLRDEFMPLLSRDPSESEVQEFLEHHPCLIPGAWTPGIKSGHYPLYRAVVSQPRLPSLKSRQPDFMWIAMHSGSWYPTLIEIERPSKQIFTKSGVPCAEFTEARNQLAQWRTWFNNPSNAQIFIEEYGVPQSIRQSRTMQLHTILVYGRREEFENNPELSKQRSSLLSTPDEELVSYDRLVVDHDLKDAITVRAEGSGQYRVVALPPVFCTSPQLADRLLHVRGFSAAIDANLEITKARAEFLKRRISYWREWAASPSSKILSHGYRE